MGGEGLGNQQRHKWGVRWAWEPLGWTRGGSLPHGDQDGRTQKQASDVSVVESAVASKLRKLSVFKDIIPVQFCFMLDVLWFDISLLR